MPHPTTGPALRPGVVGPHLPPKATVRPPQPCPAPPRAAPRRLRIPPSLSSPGQSLRHRSVATACSRARNLFSRHPSSSRCPSPAFRHSSRTVPSPPPKATRHRVVCCGLEIESFNCFSRRGEDRGGRPSPPRPENGKPGDRVCAPGKRGIGPERTSLRGAPRSWKGERGLAGQGIAGSVEKACGGAPTF